MALHLSGQRNRTRANVSEANRTNARRAMIVAHIRLGQVPSVTALRAYWPSAITIPPPSCPGLKAARAIVAESWEPLQGMEKLQWPARPRAAASGAFCW